MRPILDDNRFTLPRFFGALFAADRYSSPQAGSASALGLCCVCFVDVALELCASEANGRRPCLDAAESSNLIMSCPADRPV